MVHMPLTTEWTGIAQFNLGVQRLVAGRILHDSPVFCDVKIGTCKCHISLRANEKITATQIIFAAVSDPLFSIFGETADCIHMLLSYSRSQALNYVFCFIGQVRSRLAVLFQRFDAFSTLLLTYMNSIPGPKPFLPFQANNPIQPRYHGTEFGIHLMEKSIFGASNKLRSLIQYQPCSHFRRTCRHLCTLLEVSLTIMADISTEHSTASCIVGGFKRIMKLPGIFAHALAVPVRLIVSDKQAAGQNGSTQSAADTTAFSQRHAERCRHSNGLGITQAAAKGIVQGHDNCLGAEQLPGLVQIFCSLSDLCN